MRGVRVCVLAALVASMLIASGHRADATPSPVLGRSSLSADQITRWFNAATRSPYRASVPIGDLAATFLSEGAAAGVRSDVAFAQSIVETGWFSFPDAGYVRPGDNNFAGIGAYGDGSRLFRAPDARTGVRGQVQLLRRYADSYSNQYNIGFTPVAQLWNPPSRYDTPGGTHGWAPTWADMSGRWASSTVYAESIFRIYNSMRTYNGLPAEILATGTAPTWRGWEPLGGALVGGADAAALRPGLLDVYVRGIDDQLWHRWWNGSAWSPWLPLGGALTSDPTVSVASDGTIHVFARGTDGQLWHIGWVGGRWNSWEPLGGDLSGGPDAASIGTSIHVFVRGTDNMVYHRWWTGSSWAWWETLGGPISSDPSVVAWDNLYFGVYARSPGGALVSNIWDGASWSAWRLHDGALSSGPDASSWPGGRVDVFTQGTDGQLWQTTWNGLERSGWSGRGGVLTSDPGAASWDIGRNDVFARGTDGQLWHTFFAGG